MSCVSSLTTSLSKTPSSFSGKTLLLALHRDCEFNQTEAFECPFHSGGSFAVEERDSCPDFMQVQDLFLHSSAKQALRCKTSLFSILDQSLIASPINHLPYSTVT